jgi:hypothetical protein
MVGYCDFCLALLTFLTLLKTSEVGFISNYECVIRIGCHLMAA